MRTGSLGLDLLLGGYHPGFITELHGSESVGKSVLIVLGAIEAQRANMFTILCIPERMDLRFAQELGLDLERALVTYTPYAEDLVALVRAVRVPAFFGFDSLSNIVNEETVDTVSRTCTYLLETLQYHCSMYNSIALATSQMRERIHAPGKKTTAHFAVNSLAPFRIRLTKAGHAIKACLVRSPTRLPGQWALLPLSGAGIERAEEVMEVALAAGFVEKNGSWYYSQGTRLGQGRADAKAYMDESGLTDYLEQLIRQYGGIP